MSQKSSSSDIVILDGSPAKPTTLREVNAETAEAKTPKRKRNTLDAFIGKVPSPAAATADSPPSKLAKEEPPPKSTAPSTLAAKEDDAPKPESSHDGPSTAAKSPRVSTGRRSIEAEARRRQREAEKEAKEAEAEKKRKEREAEKEKKARQKETERYVRLKEKEAKDAEKELARKAKEEEARLAKEKKEAEKAEKEAAKVAAKEAKLKEAADKAEEKRLKDEAARAEEEVKKAREEKMKISNFFGKAPVTPRPKSPPKLAMEVDPGGFLSQVKDFEIKTGMKVAPPVRRTPLTDDEKSSVRDLLLSGENVGKCELYLTLLKEKKHSPHRTTVATQKSEDADDNSNSVQLLGQNESSEEDVKRSGGCRYKLLQFHSDYRPAYYGTWRKVSRTVGGRRPWARDSEALNYSVDSEAEWESEPEGEECESGGEEEEDEPKEEEEEEGGFLVPHGYLSDDEGEEEELPEDPEARRTRMALEADAWTAEKSGKLFAKKLRPVLLTPDVAARHPTLLLRFQGFTAIPVPMDGNFEDTLIPTAFTVGR